MNAERYILKELGFSLYKLGAENSPYKFLIRYGQVLHAPHDVLQKGWNFVNDSFRSTVCVSFPPNAIAAACLYLATRYLNHAFPTSVEWWVIFGTTAGELRTIAGEILALYERKRVSFAYIARKIAQLD